MESLGQKYKKYEYENLFNIFPLDPQVKLMSFEMTFWNHGRNCVNWLKKRDYDPMCKYDMNTLPAGWLKLLHSIANMEWKKKWGHGLHLIMMRDV